MAEAVEVEFIEVALKPYLYWEKCLKFSALYGGMVIYDGLDLFNGLDGLYLAFVEEIGPRAKSRIGIFNHWDFEEILGWEEDRREMVEVSGWIVDCNGLYDSRLLRQKRANEIAVRNNPDFQETITVGGGCNYWGTHFLADDARKTGEVFKRLSGEENRERVGNLVRVDLTWPKNKVFAEAGKKELDDSLDYELANWQTVNDLPIDRYLAFLEKRKDKPLEEAIFLEDLEPYYTGWIDAHTCYCLEDSCEGRWPISTLDTRYKPDHPYMCISLRQEGEEDIPSGYGEW